MRLPRNSRDLITFAKDLADECSASRASRLSEYRLYKSLFYNGAADGYGSKHNKILPTIDKLGSYLFSPSDVRFTIEFDSDETADWSEKADVAARHLNREFYRRRCGLSFSQANEIGLMKGCGFMKMVHGHSGFEPYVIQPEFMGVLREDIEDLDRQDAFTHTYFLTPAQLNRLLTNHPDRADIMEKARSQSYKSPESDIEQDYFHQIVMGGLQPLGVGTSPNSNQMGSVAVFGPPTPQLSPQVQAKLIQITDLWVMDDQREDWTTIRYIDPGIIIEGKYQKRNLSDIPKEQPFVKVCANETPGYFWGRSEIPAITNLQDLLNRTLDDAARIMALQARPPRTFSGFQGITDEKARALLAPGGMLIDQGGSGAKVDSQAPIMPQNMMEWIAMIERNFDDVAGFTSMTSGVGESGVRSGNHAATLLRTGTPRLRDKALAVEEQCAAVGDLSFKMLQAKEAKTFKTRTGKEFMLSQLPEDAVVRVDSHTSSPAFSGDNMQLMFALAKAGAIQGDSLIEGTHPPKQDELLIRYYKHAEEQAKFIAEHPELAAKGARKR